MKWNHADHIDIVTDHAFPIDRLEIRVAKMDCDRLPFLYAGTQGDLEIARKVRLDRATRHPIARINLHIHNRRLFFGIVVFLDNSASKRNGPVDVMPRDTGSNYGKDCDEDHEENEPDPDFPVIARGFHSLRF